MKIETNLVGTELTFIKREVTWRDAMNYAAAVGDGNPRYLDDSLEEGIIAPPLFAVAVTWPLMEKIRTELTEALPAEVLTTMVHATEHLVFHRPIRPGDTLAVGGRVAAVSPTRAGTLMVIRFDGKDRRGDHVFTEYSGAMLRGVDCAQSACGREDTPSLPDWDEPRSHLWESVIPIAREAAHLYDGCTDIVFPIHTSVAFARAVGLPDILLQGTATLATAAREIVDREASGNPERLKEIACRFSGMVIPGTEIRVELTRKKESPEGTLLGFRVVNDRGDVALQKGVALVK